MAISDYEVIEEDDEDPREDEESGTEEYDSDDSEEDPTCEILEETRLNLSNLSMKKSKSRISKETDTGNEDELDFSEIKVPELDKSDEKCFEKIHKMIQAGHLEKLKIDQCKVYLRKYGLRLTGKKDVLMERIKEHLEVIDGGGEKKYPISSFVLNCKGDACTGDVVMFEQNVYEMYSIASRSSTGPPCGTRIVVGRIVKESYGAAKQQHTFTIEVLWSQGERHLPPLHPLLIKGRNLYRLKTMRQPWADEGERKKVLLEKHSRGHIARSSRETRVQEKEMRKMASSKRIKRKESGNEGQIDQQRQNPVQRSEFLRKNFQQRQQQNMSMSILPNEHRSSLPNVSGILPNPFEHQNSVIFTEQWSRFPSHGKQRTLIQFDESRRLNIQEQQPTNVLASFYKYTVLQGSPPARRILVAPTDSSRLQGSPPARRILVAPTDSRQHVNVKNHHLTDAGFHHRKPLRSLNGSPPKMPRQLCRFYPQGNCRYGDSCKFLHERREGFT